ncbi:hypothetical protein [Coleofasciculus sp. H7-2]|uniref:hypothetical protein n=1 Tax=Coleofasciculus sp. H7-2 TaxID=3351545 RepID=UPI003670DD6F
MFISNGADDWVWKRQEHQFSQSNRDAQFDRLLPEQWRSLLFSLEPILLGASRLTHRQNYL